MAGELPSGFTLDKKTDTLPDGFTLDAPEQPQDGATLEQSLFPGLSQFNEGFGIGLSNAASGFKQLVNFGDSGVNQSEQAKISERDKRVESLGGFGTVGALAGEVAPSLVVPGGAGGSLLKKVATGVASDIASSVADPVREGQTRGGNLQTAAKFSAGTRGVGAAVSNVFTKAVNAKAGNFADKEVEDLVKTADAQDISLFFDDVAGSPLAKKASVAAEIFGSFGTGARRAKQNKEALAAADRFLERVSGDTDDFEEVVQAGLKSKLNIFKRSASRKYARVAGIIGDAGEVGTSRFDKAANAGIDAEAAKGTRASKDVQDFLARFRDAPRGDFDAMIEFRSDFNKELSDFLSGDVSISKTSIDALTNAGKALDDDMARFAGENGALKEWRGANDFYKNTVLQFKKGKLKALLNEKSAANFDEQSAWKYLVQNTTNPTRARKMWQSLDAKGRAAVRFGLMKDSLDVATRDGAPFSPARFASSLEKRLPVADQFFRGESGKELRGLIKLMRHIERAGQFAENPPTGNRLVPLLFAGVTTVSPGTAAGAVTASLGLKGLFQTKAGRNFLLAANKASEGSKSLDNIVGGLETLISRSSNPSSNTQSQQP